MWGDPHITVVRRIERPTQCRIGPLTSQAGQGHLSCADRNCAIGNVTLPGASEGGPGSPAPRLHAASLAVFDLRLHVASLLLRERQLHPIPRPTHHVVSLVTHAFVAPAPCTAHGRTTRVGAERSRPAGRPYRVRCSSDPRSHKTRAWRLPPLQSGSVLGR